MPNFCQLSTHDFYSKDAMIIFFISIYGQNSIQFNAPKKRLHNRTDTSTYIVVRKGLANSHYLFRFIRGLHTYCGFYSFGQFHKSLHKLPTTKSTKLQKVLRYIRYRKYMF